MLWQPEASKRHRVGEGMDSKGLHVCNCLQRDRACWLLQEWKKEACHDGLDSHTFKFGLRALATKLGEEAQTGPAEYLATSAMMSYRRDNAL